MYYMHTCQPETREIRSKFFWMDYEVANHRRIGVVARRLGGGGGGTQDFRVYFYEQHESYPFCPSKMEKSTKKKHIVVVIQNKSEEVR